jgi:hypothetical protein
MKAAKAITDQMHLVFVLAALWALVSVFGRSAQAQNQPVAAVAMTVQARCAPGAVPQARLIPSMSRVVVQGQAVEAQLTAEKVTGERCQARATGSLGEMAMNLVIRRVACQGEQPWSPPAMFAGVVLQRSNSPQTHALEFTNTSLGYCGAEPLHIKLIPRE